MALYAAIMADTRSPWCMSLGSHEVPCGAQRLPFFLICLRRTNGSQRRVPRQVRTSPRSRAGGGADTPFDLERANYASASASTAWIFSSAPRSCAFSRSVFFTAATMPSRPSMPDVDTLRGRPGPRLPACPLDDLTT